MSELPHARFATQPLLAILACLAAGILLFHYSNLKLTVALTATGIGLLLFAIRLHKRVSLIASVLLLGSSLCAGYLLAAIEARAVAADRIVSLFDRNMLAPNEPVELTGELKGEPETSPDGFYLTVAAERI